MKTLIIRTDNRIEVADVRKGAHSFEEFQRLTGQGFAEYVTVSSSGETIVCDDEGLLKGYEINPFASFLYGTHLHGSPIVGDVILMKTAITEDGPDYVFYEDNEIDSLLKWAKGIAKRIGLEIEVVR